MRHPPTLVVMLSLFLEILRAQSKAPGVEMWFAISFQEFGLQHLIQNLPSTCHPRVMGFRLFSVRTERLRHHVPVKENYGITPLNEIKTGASLIIRSYVSFSKALGTPSVMRFLSFSLRFPTRCPFCFLDREREILPICSEGSPS